MLLFFCSRLSECDGLDPSVVCGCMPFTTAVLIPSILTQGAVFFTDCSYVAHHLLSLGHQHKQYMPEELQAIATFIDMVCGTHVSGVC